MSRPNSSSVCVVSLAALCLGACGGGESSDESPDPTGPKDVRVAVPAADPAFIDIVTPEAVIDSGGEQQYCFHVTYDGPDAAVTGLDSMQAESGHHMVLLKSLNPKPDGTLEDCTDGASMGDYRTYILPATQLPAKHAILLEHGEQFVVQFHYINTSTRSILVRDVARLATIPVADVAEWASTFATGSLDFSIAPSTDTSITFDCPMPEDAELLFIGGHMHELGSKFEVQVGPDVANLTSVYLADPWRPAYRDVPPVTMLFNNPIALPAGSVVRTTCAWSNPSSEPILFPYEMCGSFGYIRGASQPFNCEGQQAAP